MARAPADFAELILSDGADPRTPLPHRTCHTQDKAWVLRCIGRPVRVRKIPLNGLSWVTVHVLPLVSTLSTRLGFYTPRVHSSKMDQYFAPQGQSIIIDVRLPTD